MPCAPSRDDIILARLREDKLSCEQTGMSWDVVQQFIHRAAQHDKWYARAVELLPIVNQSVDNP